MIKNQNGHFISTILDAKKSPSLCLKMQDGGLLIAKTNT
jgi:hypothetical protein